MIFIMYIPEGKLSISIVVLYKMSVLVMHFLPFKSIMSIEHLPILSFFIIEKLDEVGFGYIWRSNALASKLIKPVVVEQVVVIQELK